MLKVGMFSCVILCLHIQGYCLVFFARLERGES